MTVDLENLATRRITELVKIGTVGAYIDVEIPDGQKANLIGAANRVAYRLIRKPAGNINGTFSTSVVARPGFLRVTLNHALRDSEPDRKLASARARIETVKNMLLGCGWTVDDRGWNMPDGIDKNLLPGGYALAHAVEIQISMDREVI